MKNIILFAFLIIMSASCSKTENSHDTICDTELNCQDENCQFTVDNAVGTTSFLSCYDHWAIVVPSIDGDEIDIWYIVDEWDISYEQEGIEITFCGYVRANKLPLILPDPMGGLIYQIQLENIEVMNQ